MEFTMNCRELINRIGVTLFMSSLLLQTRVWANEVWIPRTVEDVKSNLKQRVSGISEYKMKWGDTLSVLATVTNISVEQLAKVNNIENIGLIQTGSFMYFDENKAILTIANNDKAVVQSFDLKKGEKTETSVATAEKIAQQTTTTEAAASKEKSTIKEENSRVGSVAKTNSSPQLYSLSQFMFRGVINWKGYKFTYYSQSVLAGGGLKIPGRHVNEKGYVVDGDGYIVLANNAPIGTIIDTPFGTKGKVYDRGTVGNHFDVYIR